MDIAQRALRLERMEALESYGDLAEPCDPGFQELVGFAAEVCESPVSMVTTVEGGELRLHGSLGLKGVPAAFEEMICAHTIASDGFFEVPDAVEDDRFRSAPRGEGPSAIRHSSGVTMRDRSGIAIGALCVFDVRSRSLCPFQRRTLLFLGRQAEARLDLMRSHRALREERLVRARLSAERDSLIRDLERARARSRAPLGAGPATKPSGGPLLEAF